MSTKGLALSLTSALVLTLVPTSPATPEVADPEVTCAACLVIADAGRVLYGRNESVRLPNASTTKMVTGLLVTERADPSEPVAISTTAASVGGGGLDLQPGGGFDVEELLLALMLTSSNEAAVALAEHVSGSEARFVEAMNARARSEGWDGTSFVTSHGLDRPGHFSTAEDLSAIAREVLADPVLAPMVALSETTVEGPQGAIELENRNLLLDSYEGAIGVKTGFTAGAGNVLVAAARRSRRTVIAVAMNSVDAAADAAVLLDHGFARLRRTTIVRRGERFGALVFERAGSTGIVAGSPLRSPTRKSEATVVFVARPGISLPLQSGEAVGVLKIRNRRGQQIGSVTAVAERSIEVAERPWAERALTGLLRGVASIFGSG